MNVLANIILKEDYSINAVKIKENDACDLSDLSFYIPNKFSNCNVFILITDCKITDIIPLKYDGIYQHYKMYRVKYDTPIRADSGKMKVKILLFDYDSMDVCVSENIEINCSIENYKLSHQFAITMEINNTLTETYKKIIELTNMNISIYEKISEVCKS